MPVLATLVGKKINFFLQMEKKANEESCQEQIFCNLC